MFRRMMTAGVVLALTSAACGGGGAKEEQPLADQIAPGQGVVSRVLRSEFELEITGDIEDEWKGETPLNVLTHVAPGIASEFWQLTVGILPDDVLHTAAGLTLRPAFDLIGYEGNGDYAIEPLEAGGLTEEEIAEAEKDPGSLDRPDAPIKSNAFIVVVGPSGPTNYNTLLEPCRLQIAEQGNEGAITCPELTDGKNTIGLSWSWVADPDDVIRDLTEEDSPTPTTSGSRTGDGRAASTTSVPTTTTTIPGETGINAPFPLEVDVDAPDCLSAGATITVRVRTIADAFITLVHVYSDGNHYGNTTLGSTSSSGRYNWVFVVPPAAPKGQTNLLVQVSNEEEAGGGVVPVGVVEAVCS